MIKKNTDGLDLTSGQCGILLLRWVRGQSYFWIYENIGYTTYTLIVGSGTRCLNQGWHLSYSRVPHGERPQVKVGILTSAMQLEFLLLPVLAVTLEPAGGQLW